MTPILYILDGKNILLSESELPAEAVIQRLKAGDWRFPFHFERPDYCELEGVLVIYGKKRKRLCTALSSQQSRIMERLSRGESVGQIAAAMKLSEYTIHYHIENAKRLYQVATRNELIARYSRDLTMF